KCFGYFVVDFYGWESVEMITQNPIALYKISREACVFKAHCEMNAHRENRQIKLSDGFRDQFHFISQGSIACDVNSFAVCFQNISVWISTVSAIRERTRMKGNRGFNHNFVKF